MIDADSQHTLNQIDGIHAGLERRVADLEDSIGETLAELVKLRDAYTRLYTHLAHRHLTPPRNIR
jgi:uncharacterized membrane-anchored protein YhcB (DUF1043 family)